MASHRRSRRSRRRSHRRSGGGAKLRRLGLQPHFGPYLPGASKDYSGKLAFIGRSWDRLKNWSRSLSKRFRKKGSVKKQVKDIKTVMMTSSGLNGKSRSHARPSSLSAPKFTVRQRKPFISTAKRTFFGPPTEMGAVRAVPYSSAAHRTYA